MDSLYLLIPLSVALVLLILAIFAWALHHDQFDDLEREAGRFLEPDQVRLDADQGGAPPSPKESRLEQSPRRQE